MVSDHDIGGDLHRTIHYEGRTEGFDRGKDQIYSASWGTYTKKTKIVSIIPKYKLIQDARPLESFTPISLELSLHSQSGSGISVTDLENKLHLSFPLASEGWDFGVKPITLWRRFLAEPDKLQFLADIREVIAEQGGIGIVPLPNLNGEYGSQVPYDFLQVRFDVYPGNLNFSLDSDGKILDGIVDIKDLAYIGNDWGKKGEPKEFLGDITGEQGLPDGNVDGFDLELLVRHWLKDIRDIMPSP